MRTSSGTFAFVAISLALMSTPVSAEESPAAKSAISPAAMSDANGRMAAVQAHVDAYRSGNLDRFVATFTKDAVVRADGFVAIGHEQIRALYALNFEPGAPAIRVYESGISGDVVEISIGYVFEDGQEMCCSTSHYEITNGKVSFMQTGM